jgi:hypothetical protein
MIGGIDDSFREVVLNLRAIPVADVMTALEDKWRRHMWGDMFELPADAPPLRSIPTNERFGFQKATYRHYFCSGSLDKYEGFAYHAHTPAHIKALAQIRMSSHDLNINRMRHVNIARHNRVCTLCGGQAREDEMHLLECPTYQDVRGRFHMLFPGDNIQVDESYMRTFMNPGPDEGDKWRSLADFIICCMATRKDALDRLAQQEQQQ